MSASPFGADRDRAQEYADRLRLVVVWLLVLAPIVPVALVALGAKWLPSVLLVVLFVIAAACVSVVADEVDS